MPRSQDGRWARNCEVCGHEFQQRKPSQRTCSTGCRAQLPHNTGGSRVKAGLAERACASPECQKLFQPVRESQISCSRACLRKCPSYIEAQERAEAARSARRRGSGYRRLAHAGDPGLQRFRNLRSNLRRLHGILLTWEQYQEWRERQDGFCAICRKPVEGKNAHFDHDHTTRQPRDELCGTCNQGIGSFYDNPELLRAAAAYIERHRAAHLAQVAGSEGS